MPTRSDRRPRLRMDPDERRQLILDAARRAFATQSYEEVSLSTIAREAKASEALVHKYFSTKGRLYGRVLALDAEDLAERTQQAADAMADSSTARDRIRTSIGVYLDFIAERAPGGPHIRCSQATSRVRPPRSAGVRARLRSTHCAP